MGTAKKKIYQFNFERNLVVEYESITEASKATGTTMVNIINVCKGRQNSAGGFIFSYEKELELDKSKIKTKLRAAKGTKYKFKCLNCGKLFESNKKNLKFCMKKCVYEYRKKKKLEKDENVIAENKAKLN